MLGQADTQAHALGQKRGGGFGSDGDATASRRLLHDTVGSNFSEAVLDIVAEVNQKDGSGRLGALLLT